MERKRKARASLTKTEINKIKKMYEDGVAKNKIQTKFDITRATLNKYILVFEGNNKNSDNTSEELKKICSRKEMEINKLTTKLEKAEEEIEEYKIQNEFLKVEIKKYINMIRGN